MRSIKCHTIRLPGSILAKATRIPQKKRLRADYILLTDTGAIRDYKGYAAIVVEDAKVDICKSQLKNVPLIVVTDGLSDVHENDIAQVDSEGKVLSILYETESPHNSLFLTERCNSMCIMCPQRPKPGAKDRIETNRHLIRLIAQSPVQAPEYLTLTGGEPTLLGDRLIDLIKECLQKLPQTKLVLLTNGRRFKDISYVDKLAMVAQGRLRIDIPLYYDVDTEHDRTMGVKGAFVETIQGLHNLALYELPIGIRIVILASNYTRLPEIADYIYRNLTFVSHVALMGLEVRDLAEDNLERVWVDPYDYQSHLLKACKYLFRRAIPVSIYNHQLCVIPKDLWPLSRKSISAWKNIYIPICKDCQERQRCGGFFASATLNHSAHISPISVSQNFV
ncbi:MAG TPA: His-Xaa-Ser system radical SAM maturase HxsC [Sedimentisphaerales bacterium]|nr:His-Xaa-Ser system radical SAM maturase HxsC [Sedimentisphaerales bacterium]